MGKFIRNYREAILPLAIVVSSVLLMFASLYGFLLFHTLVELFTIVIAFGIFSIAWSSRRYIDNVFLLLIGISYLFIGGLDLIHMLTYKGMNMIRGYGTDLPTQLWVAARYLEAASFVAAFLFARDGEKKNADMIRKKSYQIFVIYAVIFSAIFAAIFWWDIFPHAYVDGMGLTPFKIYSEYLISALFIFVLVLLFRKKKMFDREMLNLLSLALIMKIFSELTFTQYIGVFDFANILGHIFRFISVLLLYKAVVETGLMKPYNLLYLNLSKSEEQYRSLVEFSPDSIVVHSHGRIIYANEPAKKLFGISEGGNIVGAELAGFFQPQYRELIRSRVKKIFSGEWRQAPRTEMEVLRSDGRVVPVEVKGMKITYAGQEVVESIIRDLTDRKEAEKKIRSLAKFPEENPSPVMRALRDGRVQYANPPAREMLADLGWKEPEQLPPLLSSAVERVLASVSKLELELSCPSGRIFSVVLAPSATEGWVNIYGRDITERKRAEEELAKTQMELRRRTEEQLLESYKYLGLVNRKISLLLEMDKHAQSRKNKQEIVDYIIASALGLSGAKMGLLYVAVGQNHFNLVSHSGLEEEKIVNFQVVSGGQADFIRQVVEEKRRVNGACEPEKTGSFLVQLGCSYFVALPLLVGNFCKGFLFLGFTDRKSMDPQDLEFLDVFSKHVSSALSNAEILN